MTGSPIAEALRTAIAIAAGPAANATAAPRLVALGWATVERDRAVAELSVALGIEASAFSPAMGSEVLGSFVLVATEILDGRLDLAVVEPSTEGRLAAHLARHGEGPTIAWLEIPTGPTVEAIPGGTPGPFGPERVGADQRDGLLRLLVATPPGTI